MPELIKSINEYLYEQKRDIFILKLTDPEEYPPSERVMPKAFLNYRTDKIRSHQKLATDWLDAHGVAWAATTPEGLLEGWCGHLHVDFDGWEDPRLKAWCNEFEIDGERPKYPEKFVLYVQRYEDWVAQGGLARHEAWLQEMEDPDWSP